MFDITRDIQKTANGAQPAFRLDSGILWCRLNPGSFLRINLKIGGAVLVSILIWAIITALVFV